MTTTIIEIKPHPGGWQVYEGPGVEPSFGVLRLAIDYAKSRARFRKGEIQVFDAARHVLRIIPFDETNPVT